MRRRSILPGLRSSLSVGKRGAAGGFTIKALRRSLREDGLVLKATPSYAKDIDALRGHTETTLDQLASLSRIRIGGGDLKVERTAVTELLKIADRTSSLIVGQPEVGKSGAILEAARRLTEQGRNVICFAADRLDFTNLPQVQAEVGIKFPLTDGC